MNQLYREIDRKTEQLRAALSENLSLLDSFHDRLTFSWIYHDNALEGVVISYHELNAAMDEAIISDSTLIPVYQDVVNHKRAIEYVRQLGLKRKSIVGLDFFKKLYQILTHETQPRSAKAPARPTTIQYRKDNPLHRQYFHDISAPDKIPYLMRKLTQWLTSDEAKAMHPVRRAATAHHHFISIYPYPKHSGKMARLLMNVLLLREGLTPAIVHAIERQRYYEVLRQPPQVLTRLVAESMIGTLDAAHRFCDEIGIRKAG
ncbi:MAG: Fic family protein [Deltaproteobacteria bacterium]|nr:Fic family protein [Deltaproteobacteria bacterium]